ncbi:MAG: prepilin-type N-terminal cleavage/methylation domain-containing protein [Phycisphaerales bacterium]|nr:prepilin-type N-terminal cleavage/methylation domain-containing protein [Phycisphaerales bacterium]
MNMSCFSAPRRGFSLVELVSVLVVVASVGALLGPSVGRMRGQMRGMSSEGNLHAIGVGSAMYGLDNADRVFSYTWRAGEEHIDLSTGNIRISSSDQAAASRQAQNILHRATGRLSGQFSILNPSSRLMHRRYSHLVLADYMGNVGDSMWADPADNKQLAWQLAPTFFDIMPYGDGPPEDFGYDEDFSWSNRSIVQLWPFGSSYQVVPHAWMSDFGDSYAPVSFTPHLFTSNGQPHLGDRYLNEVAFPSGKVLMFEEFDRERVGDPYFAYDYTTVAKLMFDGSINTMRSDDARSSVSPSNYQNGSRFRWEQRYLPLDTFPVPIGGLGDSTELDMRYRWTLGGLSGIDYVRALSPARNR